METVLNILDYALNHWQTWAAYLGASGTIALVVQVIKKKWHLDTRLTVWKINAQKFIVLLLGFISTLFTLADLLVSNGTVFVAMLPQASQIIVWLMTLAVLIHRFALSGIWKRLEAFLISVRDYKASKYQTPIQPVQAPQNASPNVPASFEG